MQVCKWGNSLAVRLPAKLVEELGLKEGDDIELVAAKGGLVVARKPDRFELLREVRKYRGMRPAGYRFSRDDAHDRGNGDEE